MKNKTHYVFDTNCFYKFNKYTIDIKKVKKDNAEILGTPLAIIEIANLESDDNFVRRKKAMVNLAELTTMPVNDTPDDIFALSFGKPHPQRFKRIKWHDVIEVIINSNSLVEAKKGIKNFIQKSTKSLKTELLKVWKEDSSDYFIKSFISSDKEQFEKLKDIIRKEEKITDTKILNKKARAKFIEVTKMDISYFYMLTGLAVRGGLFTEKTYTNALNQQSMKKFDKLTLKATKKYKNSLETYIKIFLEYRREFLGQTPHRNDLFDLDFLSYLDVFEKAILVTTEKKRWIKIAEKVCPGKLMHVDDFKSKYGK